MMDRTIRVNFYGFYKGFNPHDNFILDAIQKVGPVEVSNKPDYVFYSVFDNEYLLYDQAVRIFFTGENIAPNFQLCDYAIGFERLEFGDRYLRFPFYYGDSQYRNDLLRAKQKHTDITQGLLNRKFCSFVYSNADTDGMRNNLFRQLCSYHQVDSGGKLLNNTDNRYVSDKFEFEKGYKFSIACENSSHLGYCTEKILQSFGAKTVPIYYGDKSVGLDFNEKAFVNCHKYKDLKQVLEYVEYLDHNDEAYLAMLSERAFLHQNFVEQMQNDFNCFIENIFSQRYEDAFRRNRFFWGKRMDDKYRKIYKLEKLFRRK